MLILSLNTAFYTLLAFVAKYGILHFDFVAKYGILHFDFVAKYGTDDLFFRRLSMGKILGLEATKTFMLPCPFLSCPNPI